jgi:ABC-2 type transport system permease protein
MPDLHGFAPPTVAGLWLVYVVWPALAVAVALVVVRRRDV